MSWQNRVLSEMLMESPSGRVFRPLWRGNSRSKDKRLGVFDIPGVPGAVVQDLGVTADKYPLTFYFEGPDNDLEADLFWQTCNERGSWDIVHPVYGTMTLQLVGVTQEIQPVDSGNLTVFESEWIEPGVNLPFTAITQWAEDVRAQAAVVKQGAHKQFTETFQPDLVARIQGDLAKVRRILLGVQSQVSQYRNNLINIVNNFISDKAMFASTLQNLIDLPADSIQDARARFKYHSDVLAELPDLNPVTATRDGINSLVLHDLLSAACITGMTTSLVDAELSTREEALGYIESLRTAHSNALAALDAGQALYGGRYVSQSTTYNDTARLVALTTEMLLRRSFDLSVARRFTLTRPRTPLDVAVTEGVDLDAFIAYNRLKGNDILLLPAGRSVVVYQ